MKIYLEVPDNWIDADSPFIFASGTIRDMAMHAIKQAVIEQYVSKIELPEINIPESELREALKERMVDDLIRRANKTV